MIPFNKPYLSGKETEYISNAVKSGKISGDGIYTQACHRYFEKRYGFNKALLTTSCTDALEMAAILLDLKPGDEIIAPAFTFVSTVNAFELHGAKVIFCDSSKEHPNMDAAKIKELINSRTRAIVVMHYSGVACDMDNIIAIAKANNLVVIEDAALAIDSYYKGKPLGSLGDLAAFSFHETKNVICGEGGMLVINNPKYISRAEIIREKGTNRTQFFRGEIDKYNWVDVGSSFLPSEINAAFLYAQLENLELIQNRRKQIWNQYMNLLQPLAEKGFFKVPFMPEYATNNYHMFYLVCRSLKERTGLISFLKENEVQAVFHYLSLNKSPYYKNKYGTVEMPISEKYSDCLVRLPFYFELKEEEISKVCQLIQQYFYSLK